MGGKSTTSTQQVTIPPDVLARYNAVNTQAQQVAGTPFQQYSTDPSAFVAPLNSTQLSGIANTNAAANQAQPYFNAATGTLNSAYNTAQPYFGAGESALQTGQALGTGLNVGALGTLQGANAAAQPLTNAAGTGFVSAFNAAQPYNQAATGAVGGALGAAAPLQSQAQTGINAGLAGAQPYQLGSTALALGGAGAVNPSTLDSAAIQQYMNPYLQTVLGSTSSLLNQNNQQQQAGQLGNAINQGAFGGDRTGIEAANLEQQQNLANANIYSGIASNAYDNSLATAQQQQSLGLGAAQANRAALQTAAGQLQGIGEQGYTQDLGAASALAGLGQQEFGQGLGAAQQLQSIGQQGYAQGTGTAGAEQGLAAQLFGQGATTAEQQAAIGNSLFGQGLGASQQQAALGTGQYGIGSQTASQLAGLGTGAQAAALQGAQAQLGAGQVAQQTQQAGQTALYNQFLQQQSYPFQVAQFLANIAEGTGALSGSTTTTTQPGGFFSDERLKEDIVPIGRTFDGQKIVKFRYKGDPRHQIGLLAQDVEKRHPEAVGETQGFKTVDYDEATRDAERGKRARGGLAPSNDNGWFEPERAKRAVGGPGLYPGMPGEWPSDIAALLQAQEQMYTPYNGGLYGGAAAGAPRGGSSYVPQASLPVSHLAVAGGLGSAPPSALAQASAIANLAKQVQGLWPRKKPGTPSDPYSQTDDEVGTSTQTDADNTDNSAKRGGRIGRDDGGTVDPYDDSSGPKLAIPTQGPSTAPTLAVAGPPPKQPESGFQQLLALGQDAAKVASMFSRGGLVPARRGYDDGGDVPFATGPTIDLTDPEGDAARAQAAADAAAQQAKAQRASDAAALAKAAQTAPGGASTTVGNPIWNAISGAWNSLAHDTPDPSYAKATFYGGPSGAPVGLGGAGPPVVHPPPVAPPAPQQHRAMRPSGLAPQQSAPPPFQPNGGLAPSVVSALGQQEQGDLPELNALGAQRAPPMPVQPTDSTLAAGMGGPPADLGSAVGTGLAARSGQEGAGEASGAPGQPGGGFLGEMGHKLGHMDTPTLMAILSGIGAMGTAPTRSLGVALAAGLEGGAQGYMGAQSQQAELARTKAQAQEEQATAGAIPMNAWANLQARYPGMRLVPVPKGQEQPTDVTIPGDPSGQHYRPIPNVPGSVSGTGTAPSPQGSAPQHTYLGSAGLQAAQEAGPSGRGFAVFKDPSVEGDQIKAQDTVMQDGTTGQQQIQRLNRWAQVTNASVGTLVAPGAMSEMRGDAVNYWNTLMTQLGHPEYGLDGLADQQMATKLTTGVAAMRESELHQRSAYTLAALLQGTPNMNMNKDAMLTLIGDEWASNQQSVDRANYLKEFQGAVGANSSPATSRDFFTQDAMNAFNKDFSPDRYMSERNVINKLIASPQFGTIDQALQDPDPTKRAAAEKLLDEKAKMPGLHGYWTGNRGFDQ